MCQAILRPDLLRENRALVVGYPALVVEGRLQKKNGTLSIQRGSGPASTWTTARRSSTAWRSRVLLFDVNVLVHAHRRDAPDHSK